MTPSSRSVFLLANGPSLKRTNLDKLKDRESWAMNRIHLLYNSTRWLPTRLFWTDLPNTLQRADLAKHINSREYPCYVRHDALSQAAGKWDDVEQYADVGDHCIPFVHCRKHSTVAWGDKFPQSWHPEPAVDSEMPNPYSIMLCKFGSGFSVLLQMAAFEGFSPIYIVGADLGFKPQELGKPDPNHFDPDYWYDSSTTKAHTDLLTLGILYGHLMAKNWCDEHGIEVFNATKGGELEVYPRVDFDSLF